MNQAEKLKTLLKDHQGFLLTKQVTRAGIPRVYIANLLQQGVLERRDRGVYATADGFEDEMYKLQARYTRAVFSHDTALYLHDLTDRDPVHYTVTVPQGYNPGNIKALGVKVFTIKKDLYPLGLTKSTTPFGREIWCYNRERTICDMIRSRRQMDPALLGDALKRYTRRKDRNVPLLMRYTALLRVTKLVNSYLEVLL